MSVRSGRVVKTVRTVTRPTQEAACAYTSYNCTLSRVEGFEYCTRHILEDKSAPFRQCNYIFTSTGKRCLRPAPTSDRKEGYCGEHSKRSLVVRQRAARRRQPRETPEALLAQLSHHQMDTHTAGQNAIPDPVSVPSLASSVLEYASDTDSEEELSALPQDSLPRREADSELDSADSDADPLEHAQVFTTEEITRIYLEKLQKLKCMYVGEYKRLAHILRESRRKYLQAVRLEKESMVSIHNQPKSSPEEQKVYEQLKAMARYHKHLGTHALLHRQQLERRLQVTEGVNYKPGPSVGCVKCVYSEGSWRCGEKSIPLSKYCSKHILHDPYQVLYGACGASRCGDDQCSTPVISLPYTSTCIYHTPVPDPLPVSSLLEGEEVGGGMEDDDQLCGPPDHHHLPPRHIIDLPETHSFIVTELPPEHVMEGDGEEVDDPTPPSSATAVPTITPATSTTTPATPSSATATPTTTLATPSSATATPTTTPAIPSSATATSTTTTTSSTSNHLPTSTPLADIKPGDGNENM